MRLCFGLGVAFWKLRVCFVSSVSGSFGSSEVLLVVVFVVREGKCDTATFAIFESSVQGGRVTGWMLVYGRLQGGVYCEGLYISL